MGIGPGAPPSTASPKIGDGKLVLKVYAVADLVSREVGEEATSLLRVITRTVEPTTWDVQGGSASIEYFAEGKSLVVNQTVDIHERIMILLTEMRQAKAEQERKQTK